MLQNLTIDAFALTPDVLAALDLFAAHRRLARCKVAVRKGGIDAAIAHYAGSVTPAVLILEDEALDGLDRLAEVCDPGTRVVVVGGVNDIHHYRALMAKGVADYWLRPLETDPIIEATDRLFADPTAAPKGKVVSFWGVRGGAGSSCLAQNMAWLMGEHGHEPALYIDCDLSFGSSQVALGLDARQTLADMVAHAERLDPVFVERSLIAHGTNLKVLASPGDLRPRPPVTIEAMHLLIDIARRLAPVVVVDMPRVWTDWTEQVLRLSSEVVVTAWPDFSSLKNAKALIETLDAPLKLVLNGLDFHKRTQLSIKDFEDTLGVKPVLSLPFDPALFGEAANAGQIAAQMSPSHKVVKQMDGLALSLSGKANHATERKSPLSLLSWRKA